MTVIDRLVEIWSRLPRLKGRLWQIIGSLLTLAAVIYLAYVFQTNRLVIRQFNGPLFGKALAGILGLYVASLALQFIVWARLIAPYRKVNLQDVEIYARMVMMRSLPGGAWHWLGRISMYSVTGLPMRVVVLGNFLEWALLILVGLGVWLSLSLGRWGCLAGAAAWGVALFLAAAWQKDRGWFRRLVEALIWVMIYVPVWLAGGLVLYLCVLVVVGPGVLSWLDCVRVNTAAGTMTMLITFLPSSLGVREVSFIALLRGQVAPALALALALLMRIIVTLSDLGWGMTGWLLSRAFAFFKTKNI
jgi:hypothetical protein